MSALWEGVWSTQEAALQAQSSSLKPHHFFSMPCETGDKTVQKDSFIKLEFQKTFV